jgi:hypothetical protein
MNHASLRKVHADLLYASCMQHELPAEIVNKAYAANWHASPMHIHDKYMKILRAVGRVGSRIALLYLVEKRNSFRNSLGREMKCFS